MIGRFAPSTTGRAHPGTLLSALLVWLDARRHGRRVVLRLEDLDPERCRPAWRDLLQSDLEWFGLDWDRVERQSDASERHARVLDMLDAQGRLYPCSCSRTELRARAATAADGGNLYDGRCRDRTRGPLGWRQTNEPLRLRLDDRRVELLDEGGRDASQNPLRQMGDPIVRRRDGSIAYQLAVVADDWLGGVTHVVRGHDLLASTATQVQLYAMLGATAPVFRHHLLLRERHGGKLAKLHGAVDVGALRQAYDAPTLCGLLAYWAGIAPEPLPTRPSQLLPAFAWSCVRNDDVTLTWNGIRLASG